MKKITLLCFLLYSCNNFSYVKETRDSLGRVDTRLYYENGVVVHSIAFYPNGLKHIEKYYDAKTGLFSGPYYEYFDNGHIKKRGTARNGQLEDTLYLYYRNGEIWNILTMKNGVANGPAKVFLYHKKLGAEGNFVNDKQDGDWMQYDSLGNKIAIDHYSNGTLLKEDTLDYSFYESLKGSDSVSHK